MSAPDFAADAVAILPDLVALRRALHADPELGLDLPRTQQKVLDALEGLPLEITTGTRTTSVVAVLRGGRPGPAVLLRGDMDALPIEETTGLEFASTNGTMHACGHDLHTAGLVGAARLLSERRDELHGSVIFMFQPGEEGHGGAKVMIEEGLLDAAGERPVAAYAIHVAPGPRGLFATRSGAVAAGSNQLFVTVDGRGGHGSQPHQTLDPVPADVRFDTMYPVTVNDPAETAETVDVLQGVFGEQRVVIMPTPMMGSEDFAFVLDEVPGTFIALMTSPPDADPSTIEWNHSPRVLFDDAVLGDQAAALASVAFARTAR